MADVSVVHHPEHDFYGTATRDRRAGKLIMIEGIDAVGKSTLAKQLYDDYPTPVALLHAGPPVTRAWTQEYISPLVPILNGWTVICDRWYLGEPVWSTIFGREPIISFSDFRTIEQRIGHLGCEVECIYLHRDHAEVLAELDERNESAAHMQRAADLYESAIQASTFSWFRGTLPELQGMYE